MARFRIIVSSFLLVGLLVLSVGVAAAQSEPGTYSSKAKPAKARLTWSVDRVEQTLGAGQTATIDVTLTSSVDVPNAAFRVPGGLGRIVSVSPATLNLKAGVAQSVRLTIKLPTEGAHSQSGVVQVRSGKRNLSQALRVNIRVPGTQDEGDD